jgi:hypothetical protein
MTATILPPYSGTETPCPKCSNPEADTRHQPALAPGMLLQSHGGRLRRGPLPERLQRECQRCEFRWDEALCPPGCGMTVEALAHALDNATPYPIELHPEVCTYAARYLLECLHITARPEHPLWQYDDGRPDPGPTPEPMPMPICEAAHETNDEEDACERRRAPQPETPPADSEATE